MRSTMAAGWARRERDTRKAADAGENMSCTTRPRSPNIPPSNSSSRLSSFNISLAWDFEDEKMSHVTPPGSPLKIRRTFSDRLFRRNSDLSQPDVKLGLRAFYDPPDADVDIVFLHGITGHRETTWAAPGSRPWPEKLLPEKVPRARILSFGYDAGVIGWRSRLSGNRIGDHAKNLLITLAAYREADYTNERPIIFVCHSLGGLVCQDALLSSKTNPERHLQQILRCTRGILFLGTPHSGTGLAVVGQRLSRLAGLVSGTNPRLVEVLRRDSEVLARIQDEFHSLLRSKGDQIKITCAYEEVPIQGIGEVVPKHSAILRGYPAIGIHADHRGIARFDTMADPGFVAVSNEVQRWARDLKPAPEKDKLSKSDTNPRGLEGPLETKGLLPGVNIPGVTIHGDVLHSIVVNGGQVINGGIVFGGD
ncbi:hypothetical protein QBC34DRAFT_400149 [Podospora aff. communis PSN243]|uniref:DUF676 domain-containing protein n=1 Tax=Podospora aff. communis PSN243 TaxID=3040156 RepID=A0AAV9GVD9_9PEZI|nr:hypothetical protein QBC34DRAFT_400149 [Podospora aff. communis PSN243]